MAPPSPSWVARLAALAAGLIETYPGEAYPTDTAAVAAAIAVHGRATGVDHARVLARWEALVEARQIDHASGLVFQRMGALDGRPHDAPRGSGTALAAYFAGFALAPARAFGQRAVFAHLYRTTDLFGAPVASGGRLRFLSGGPIGNALLLAMLTSGPERAP